MNWRAFLGEGSEPADVTAPPGDDVDFARLRRDMVETQIASRGIADARVLAALRKVPRHEFVPEAVRAAAYDDRPLAIGFEQTISQPYIVALMTQAARLSGHARVLEIGTGSGYQTAVLAELARHVYSVEIVPALAERAAALLARFGYTNVEIAEHDGSAGWPEEAPFDAVLAAAAPERIPRALLAQLKPGGRLVMPVGRELQQLIVVTRTADGFREEQLCPVAFVRMTGRVQRDPFV